LNENRQLNGADVIFALSALDPVTNPYLGRWPRLLHFAPLALELRITASQGRRYSM